MPKVYNPTVEEQELLRATASSDPVIRQNAMAALIKAVAEPLRDGVMSGEIYSSVFTPIPLAADASPEFPLSFLAPGTEGEYTAYTLPRHGKPAEMAIEGDYVMIPTFAIGNGIDWLLRYAESARWDIVGKAMEVLEAGFVKKINDDAWHTVLSAGVDRNILINDSDANAGQFTKRLVSVGKVIMRRNGGGNSTSVNRKKMTDFYFSPEAQEDMRNWNVDQLDEVSRREIFVAEDGQLNRIFQVNLHDLDELGEGQEYQLFYTSVLGASLAAGGDLELAVGLDLRDPMCFVMPVRKQIEIFDDPMLHRQQRAGMYGWGEFGYANLDNRCVILFSF